MAMRQPRSRERRPSFVDMRRARGGGDHDAVEFAARNLNASLGPDAVGRGLDSIGGGDEALPDVNDLTPFQQELMNAVHMTGRGARPAHLQRGASGDQLPILSQTPHRARSPSPASARSRGPSAQLNSDPSSTQSDRVLSIDTGLERARVGSDPPQSATSDHHLDSSGKQFQTNSTTVGVPNLMEDRYAGINTTNRQHGRGDRRRRLHANRELHHHSHSFHNVNELGQSLPPGAMLRPRGPVRAESLHSVPIPIAARSPNPAHATHNGRISPNMSTATGTPLTVTNSPATSDAVSTTSDGKDKKKDKEKKSFFDKIDNFWGNLQKKKESAKAKAKKSKNTGKNRRGGTANDGSDTNGNGVNSGTPDDTDMHGSPDMNHTRNVSYASAGPPRRVNATESQESLPSGGADGAMRVQSARGVVGRDDGGLTAETPRDRQHGNGPHVTVNGTPTLLGDPEGQPQSQAFDSFFTNTMKGFQDIFRDDDKPSSIRKADAAGRRGSHLARMKSQPSLLSHHHDEILDLTPLPSRHLGKELSATSIDSDRALLENLDKPDKPQDFQRRKEATQQRMRALPQREVASDLEQMVEKAIAEKTRKRSVVSVGSEMGEEIRQRIAELEGKFELEIENLRRPSTGGDGIDDQDRMQLRSVEETLLDLTARIDKLTQQHGEMRAALKETNRRLETLDDLAEDSQERQRRTERKLVTLSNNQGRSSNTFLFVLLAWAINILSLVFKVFGPVLLMFKPLVSLVWKSSRRVTPVSNESPAKKRHRRASKDAGRSRKGKDGATDRQHPKSGRRRPLNVTSVRKRMLTTSNTSLSNVQMGTPQTPITLDDSLPPRSRGSSASPGGRPQRRALSGNVLSFDESAG